MANALWITLIGMGLVFVAILLLWGGMALLVRLTAERGPGEPVEDVVESPAAPKTEAAFAGLTEHKRRAAAVAVSAALALRKAVPQENGTSQVGTLSAWQAVNRANQVNQALNIPRKKVVR